MPYVYNPLLKVNLDQTGAGGGGGVVDGDKGDITVSASGATWTVDSGVITNDKVSASAEISVSKLADGAARQLLQTDAAGTGVEWTDSVDIPGTLDVTGLSTFDNDIILNDGGTYTTTLQTITPTAARTISFPDATGTVALVAGSSGQLLYNNAGANAGASTLTYDGTNVTLTGRFISSLNGAASAPPGTFTGTWFTGGTATTTKPQVLIEPTGATSTAWSTSGTGLGVNAASGFTGNLLDLQVNGTSRFSVSSAGEATSFSNFTAASGGLIRWTSRGGLAAPADGVYQFYPTAGSGDVRVMYGGASSSFPALKRSTTALQARLADDSAYTTIDAQHRLQGTAPASATATGTAGDIRYDADYIYICTATNTWKRAAITTWV